MSNVIHLPSDNPIVNHLQDLIKQVIAGEISSLSFITTDNQGQATFMEEIHPTDSHTFIALFEQAKYRTLTDNYVRTHFEEVDDE